MELDKNKKVIEEKSKTVLEDKLKDTISNKNIDYMTINKYITNPYGKGVMAVSPKEFIQNILEPKYSKMLKEHKTLKVKIYKEKNGNLYTLVFIPSMSIAGVFYETLIRLIPMIDTPKDYDDYKIEFFTNYPAFVFTFAYVFNIHDLLIDEFKNKFQHEVLINKPETRNPYLMIGMDKALYIACSYLLSKFTIDDIKKYASEYSHKELDSIMSTVNEKLNQLKKKKDFLTKAKKNSVILALADKIKSKVNRDERKRTKTSTGVSNVNNVSRTAGVKTAKRTKTVK